MSRSFELNKLVRKNVLDNMLQLGQQVTYRELSGEESREKHNAKVREEAAEFGDADAKLLDEGADLFEAIEARAQLDGISFEAIRARQLARREERGGLDDHLFVEYVTLKDDDKWVGYYAQNPERFPEV